MRRTFHLRFVPFGTSFKRLGNALRHTSDVPEGAALCDNEIVVDVGGCCFGYREPGATDSGKSLIFDHHFTRRDNYPSASAAVLHHASHIVELLDPHDEIWIVTHREADFDALCAVYLVKSLLGGAPDDTDQQQLSKIEPGVLRSYGLGCSGWNDVEGGNGKILRKINWYNPEIRPSAPAAWAVLLAAYASCVDSGKRLHADRCRRLHSVLYAGILRRRSLHEDGMEPLFREARRAIVLKELNPIFDALFDDDSRFSPELELLRNEARAYDRDIARARKSIVSLQVGPDFEEWYATLQRLPLLTSSGEKNPAHWGGSQSQEVREADGVYIRDPECLLFKEWAREDFENSSMGRGFLFTAVAYTRNPTANTVPKVEYFFALDQERAQGAHLYNLWAALQFGEVSALRGQGLPLDSKSVVRPGFAGRAGDFELYFADPWFDGGNYRATIVVSPHRGTIVPAGQMSDLGDDAVARVVVRELELCAYVGPTSLRDYSATDRERSMQDDGSGSLTTDREDAVGKSLSVEDAALIELSPEHYRFGKVQLDDRLNLNNRPFAEQIGRQLWPFLEPTGVRTCPSDFIARHLIISPSCITVWNRRGIVVAHKSAGRAEADLLESRLHEVASVAREVRLFKAEVQSLLAGDPGADTEVIQVRSHALLQRVINVQLDSTMPENGALRRFYDATRFDGVLGMLRELSTEVVRYTEAKRAKLQTRC